MDALTVETIISNNWKKSFKYRTWSLDWSKTW